MKCLGYQTPNEAYEIEMNKLAARKNVRNHFYFLSTSCTRKLNLAYIRDLEKSSPGGAPLVTEVKPLGEFYEAEEYHKNYYAQNQSQPYCQIIISPKIKKAQAQFAKLLKKI